MDYLEAMKTSTIRANISSELQKFDIKNHFFITSGFYIILDKVNSNTRFIHSLFHTLLPDNIIYIRDLDCSLSNFHKSDFYNKTQKISQNTIFKLKLKYMNKDDFSSILSRYYNILTINNYLKICYTTYNNLRIIHKQPFEYYDIRRIIKYLLNLKYIERKYYGKND